MSAAYAIGGALIGAMLARCSPAETSWAALVAPAAICFWVGWYLEWEQH